jgi:hypothetical protein
MRTMTFTVLEKNHRGHRFIVVIVIAVLVASRVREL